MEFGVVLAWLLVVLVLGLLAVPLAAWVFPRGDHGAYGFTLGIVVVGVVAHLVGHLSYRLVAAATGVLVLIILSALAYLSVDIDHRETLKATGLFIGAFLFMVVLRAIEPSAGTNPHWVGEMFLDFGLLNALERADSLPPTDMWFAGETVRYHYGGHLLTSILAGLSLTAPAYAYNLGLATFFAMLVTMAWGVTRSIARPMAISSRLAGALGVFFVAFAANLDTALRTLGWVLPRGVATWLGDLVGVDSEALTWSPGDFFYWDSSRIITREGVTTATEFPLFSWLHGDLHAHVLVKPLLLLVVAIGVAYWYTPPSNRRRRAILAFGVLPPVMGLIAVVNMWSVPIVFGLAAVFFLFSPGHPADLIHPDGASRLTEAIRSLVPNSTAGTYQLLVGLLDEGGRIIGAIALALVSAIVSILWSAPYWYLVVLGGPGESVARWETGTPLGPFLVVQGAFILGFIIYLGARLGRDATRPVAITAGVLAAIVLFAIAGWTVLGLATVILVGAWWFLRVDLTEVPDDGQIGPDDRFGPETMLLIAGIGIIAIVELVKLEGDSFNSVFKPFADVWQLWAVALAIITVRLVDGWPVIGPDRNRSAWAGVALMFVIVLVLTTGLYGAFAIPTHVEEGNSWSDATAQVQDEHGYTLDASAYVDVLYPQEAAAIEWIDDLAGQPTIVTAVPAGYWWRPEQGDGSAAPASLTGVPTVVGWHHAGQYHGWSIYDERVDAVIDIYTGDMDRQTELLETYDVEYIYVGPAERATWWDLTITDHPAVSVAEQFDAVTIYEVDLGS